MIGMAQVRTCAGQQPARRRLRYAIVAMATHAVSQQKQDLEPGPVSCGAVYVTHTPPAPLPTVVLLSCVA